MSCRSGIGSDDSGCLPCSLGVPLLPLYMRGAGLQERFPNWLRVGVLIGYNYISSCTRKIGSIPTPLEASCSLARQTVLMEFASSLSARPTLSRRVHFGPPRGYPGITSPTVAPERLSVELQHIFFEGLGRVVAERLDFCRETGRCSGCLVGEES